MTKCNSSSELYIKKIIKKKDTIRIHKRGFEWISSKRKETIYPHLHQLWDPLPFLVLTNVYTPLSNRELGGGLA